MLINGVKYSCDACIKSHKASQCDHADRPLKLLKPRGRPATTCDHCKDMRKTKNVNPSGSCNCSKLEKLRKEKGITIEEDMMLSGNLDMCLCIRGEPCKCHSRRKKAQKKDKKDLLSPGSDYTESSPPINGDMIIDNRDILTALGPVEIPDSIRNSIPISNGNGMANSNQNLNLMDEFLANTDVKINEPFYDLNIPLNTPLNDGPIENFGQMVHNDNHHTNGNPLQQNMNGNIEPYDNIQKNGSQGLTLHDLDELLSTGTELSNVV